MFVTSLSTCFKFQTENRLSEANVIVEMEKRIVFNMCFHGIGGLFWINVLVSIVWIFELDHSKMLKFWYLWDYQTCWWGQSITCQDREKLWEQRVCPPGSPVPPSLHFSFFCALGLLCHSPGSHLSQRPKPGTTSVAAGDSGAVWPVRAMQTWSVKMGCKEEGVMFSKWDLTGLNLGLVPKHLAFEIFGVWQAVLCWFSFSSGISCSRFVTACPPSMFAQVEHLHWPWASYRVT